MARGLLGAFVPSEIVVAMREVDVFFMEDSCPLERRACVDFINFAQILAMENIVPCKTWQVEQWQYLALRGFSLLS